MEVELHGHERRKKTDTLHMKHRRFLCEGPLEFEIQAGERTITAIVGIFGSIFLAISEGGHRVTLSAPNSTPSQLPPPPSIAAPPPATAQPEGKES